MLMRLQGDMKEKVWGGKHLLEYHKSFVEESIGEIWEFSCHTNGESKANQTGLCQLMKLGLLGDKLEELPILIKMLDAEDNLSVQVHPDDELGALKYKSKGKTEAWFILDADPEAEIILGQEDVPAQQLIDEVTSGDFTHLKSYRVRSGEVYFVPAGTIHAIGKGIRLVEIQESSDVTFRIFDYGRDRELHIDQAIESLKNDAEAGKVTPSVTATNEAVIMEYIDNKFFSLSRMVIQSEVTRRRSSTFEVVACVGGNGVIMTDTTSLSIRTGDFILVPNDTDEYKIRGQVDVLLLSDGGEDNEK